MDKIKLDEKDKKILIELQKNSRASFSKIGKAVGLPKSVVAYRIKRLVDSKFLTLFCAVINKKFFNYIQARLFLKFHNFNQTIEEKLVSFLKNKKDMHWIASLNGCYDFCIIILAKDIDSLNQTYSEIIYKFSKYILDKELSIITKSYYFSMKYILQNETKIEYKNKTEVSKNSKFKITKLDFDIINLIKQNSRLSLLDISEKLHSTPQTIRTRIKAMIKNNVIQSFKIRINHKMLGLHHFHVFLNLSKIDESKEKEIIEFISSLNSTINIIKGTGKYDLEFESLLINHFELYDIISKIKNKFPENIQNTDSCLIYKIYEINTVKYEI